MPKAAQPAAVQAPLLPPPGPPPLSIPVLVTDDSGHPVEWLSERDFSLNVGGDQRAVLRIRHGRDEAAAIGIMTDVSISKCPPASAARFARWGKCTIIQARHVMNLLALTLGGRNSMFLAAFARHFHLIEPYTNDRSEIDRRIPFVHVSFEFGDEGTALYDNMIKGITMLDHGPSARRALIVVSDGEDEISWHGVDDVIAAAQRAEVVVYVLVLGEPPLHEYLLGLDDSGRALFRDSVFRICSATGGRGFMVYTPDSVSHAAQQVASDIDNQYVLEFNRPKDEGDAQSVEVLVKDHPGMHARAPQVIRLRHPDSETVAMP